MIIDSVIINYTQKYLIYDEKMNIENFSKFLTFDFLKRFINFIMIYKNLFLNDIYKISKPIYWTILTNSSHDTEFGIHVILFYI